MARLLDTLAETLSLNNTSLSDNAKIQECRHKLEHTYVLVDEKCMWLPSIGELLVMQDSYGNIRESNLFHDNTSKIELINIDSGVYIQNGIPFQVMRRPKKFYKKSFFSDAYLINDLSEDYAHPFDYFSIHKLRRESLYRNGKFIFYWNFRVAQILENGLLKMTPIFEQDIKEAIERGTIKV